MQISNIPPYSDDWINQAENAILSYLHQFSDSPEIAGIHLYGGGAVGELEAKLAQYYGKRYGLCVSSATMGLLALALALDLHNQEFITTPYTYGASLSGLLLLGNRPIFADIEPQTLTLDPDAVRNCITPRTKAILAVDILGNPCDQVALRQIADEYGIWYLADAAQSLGATRQGQPASVLADAIVVSFTVGKSVFAGEGGAIMTDNSELYQKLVWFTQHPERQKRDVGLLLDNELGINGRIHPIAAVIANATFDIAFKRLSAYQEQCMKIIEILNTTGLTEPIKLVEQQIIPSFFRLTVARYPHITVEEIENALRAYGYLLSLVPPPIRLIYQQPTFLTQYQIGLLQHSCLNAEQQTHLRLCVTNE
jgi:dTDP-4-amino-4,6-dideoxygalactose transaminase